MNTFRILLAEIGYRKLNFVLSLTAVTIAVMLFVAGPMLVAGYSRATEAELGELQDRVEQSAQRLSQAEAEAATRLKHAEDEARAELADLENQTRIVMRDMGFNLTILHRNADTIEFLSTGRVTEEMPQEHIDRLAGDRRLTMVTHLVATLRGQTELEGRTVPLRGYLPETPQLHRNVRGKPKPPMGYAIEPGTVQLGHALGKDREPGQSIEIGGRTFRIAAIGPEKGSSEDITVAMHLSDAQGLLGKPERINEIMALECRCAEASLPLIRRQIANILPETHVIRDTSKADARARQRAMVAQKHKQLIAQQKRKHAQIIATHEEALQERQQAQEHTAEGRRKIQALMLTLADVITPLVVLVSAVWVGLLALSNVRERQTEIGILRALGKGSATIASLFLGKAVLLGLLGAAAGLLMGIATARWLGAGVLNVAADQFHVHYPAIWIALIGAPLLSAVASYLPTLSALLQDPAVVLRDR